MEFWEKCLRNHFPYLTHILNDREINFILEYIHFLMGFSKCLGHLKGHTQRGLWVSVAKSKEPSGEDMVRVGRGLQKPSV